MSDDDKKADEAFHVQDSNAFSDSIGKLKEAIQGNGLQQLNTFNQLFDICNITKASGKAIFTEATSDGLMQSAVDFRELCRASAVYSGSVGGDWLQTVVAFYSKYMQLDAQDVKVTLDFIINGAANIADSWRLLGTYGLELSGRLNTLKTTASGELAEYQHYFDQALQDADAAKKQDEQLLNDLEAQLAKAKETAIIVSATTWLGGILGVIIGNAIAWSKVSSLEDQVKTAQQNLQEAIQKYDDAQSAEEKAKQMASIMQNLMTGTSTMATIVQICVGVFTLAQTLFEQVKANTEVIKTSPLPPVVIAKKIEAMVANYISAEQGLAEFSQLMTEVVTSFKLDTDKKATPLPPLISPDKPYQPPANAALMAVPDAKKQKKRLLLQPADRSKIAVKNVEKGKQLLSKARQELFGDGKKKKAPAAKPVAKVAAVVNSNDGEGKDGDDVVARNAYTAFLIAYPASVSRCLELFQNMHSLNSLTSFMDYAVKNEFDQCGSDLRSLVRDMFAWITADDPYQLGTDGKLIMDMVKNGDIKTDEDWQQSAQYLSGRATTCGEKFTNYQQQWNAALARINKNGVVFGKLQKAFADAMEKQAQELAAAQAKYDKASKALAKKMNKVKNQKTFTWEDAENIMKIVEDSAQAATKAAAEDPEAIGDGLNVAKDLVDFGKSIYDREVSYQKAVANMPDAVKKKVDAATSLENAKSALAKAEDEQQQASLLLQSYMTICSNLGNLNNVYTSMISYFTSFADIISAVDIKQPNSQAVQYLSSNFDDIAVFNEKFALITSSVIANYTYQAGFPQA